MTNYRRYQPYRYRSGSSNRRWVIIGWGFVAVVVIVLVRNGIGSVSRSRNAAKEAEIKLANDSNASTTASGIDLGATIPGNELTAKDCTKPISQVLTDKPLVSLTLDGGGIVGDAEKVLEVLKEKNIPATLFVTGTWVEANRAVVKSYAQAKIDVFNHSYSHPSFKDLSHDKIDDELTKAESAISEVTAATTKPYFRPPFGDYDEAALSEIHKRGYCVILWTVDSEDWKDGATVDGAKARVVNALKNGAIIMLQANSDIAAALTGPLVDEIRGKGFGFVSLRNLLKQNQAVSANKNTNTSVKANSNKNKNASSNKNSD